MRSWLQAFNGAMQVGPYIVSRLRELQQKHDIIGDVRGKGLMLGLELVRDRKTKVRPGTKTWTVHLGNT